MDLILTAAWQWQERMQKGEVTSEALVARCLSQIESHNHHGMKLNAVLNTAPAEIVRKQAIALDQERARGKVRSPMHGIPIIVKDVFISDSSLGMPTTAGTYCLREAMCQCNSPLVQRLVNAGMILVGKANMTELCGLKTQMRLGWSALGGQTQSPYIKGGMAVDEAPCGHSMMCGSSSGPAASVAAGFSPVSIGTETTGSLIIPANRGALYSLKIGTAKATPVKQQAQCISKTYDSLGAMTKSARDLTDMTRIILGTSCEHESNCNSETQNANMINSPRLRLGFVDIAVWQYPDFMCPLSTEIREILATRYAGVIQKLSEEGFKTVKNVMLATSDVCKYNGQSVVHTVGFAEFKHCFGNFAQSLSNTNVKTLQDMIEYNQSHPDLAMPPPFTDQKHLLAAEADSTSQTQIQKAIEHGRDTAGRDGIDRVMTEYGVDLLIGPGDSDLYTYAACAGYPIGTVPLSTIAYSDGNSRPEGLSVVGIDEETILEFMMQFERVFPTRPLPEPMMD